MGAVSIRTTNGKAPEFTQLEIDFVVNKGNECIYIQSAYSVPDAEKHDQEIRPFLKVGDSFRKIIVVNGDEKPWVDDNGIVAVGVRRSLLDESLIG